MVKGSGSRPEPEADSNALLNMRRIAAAIEIFLLSVIPRPTPTMPNSEPTNGPVWFAIYRYIPVIFCHFPSPFTAVC